MKQRAYQIIFQSIIIVTLFSIWAVFALLVINKFYYETLSGYRIGRICIWEFVALLFSFLLSVMIIRKWGNIEVKRIDNESKLILNPKYGTYFIIYFLLAIAISVWQFILFSQQF